MPGGGGYSIPGLYHVKNEKFSVPVDNLRTYAPDYGSITQVYNGIDMNVNARTSYGLQLQAGTSTGQRKTDYCDIRDDLPEQTGGFSTASEVPQYSPVNPFCNFSPGVTTRFTAASSYTIPKIHVLVSSTFQSGPGEPLAANWTVSPRTHRMARRIVRRRAEHHDQGAQSTVMTFPRVNQLDLRIGKILRFNGQRANLSLDLFNALNADTVLTYNQNFTPGGAWLVPTSVLTARTAKITVSTDF